MTQEIDRKISVRRKGIEKLVAGDVVNVGTYDDMIHKGLVDNLINFKDGLYEYLNKQPVKTGL